MTCPSCATWVEATATYCPACGTRLPSVGGEQQAPPDATREPAPEATETTRMTIRPSTDPERAPDGASQERQPTDASRPPTAAAETAASAGAPSATGYARTIPDDELERMIRGPAPPPSATTPPPTWSGRYAPASTGTDYAPTRVQAPDPTLLLLVELFAGVFGFLGIGHVLAGRTVRGIVLLVAYWAFLAFEFLLMFVLVGFCLVPLNFLLPLASALWLRGELREGGPRGF